jgi:RHS repeat-associated protein
MSNETAEPGFAYEGAGQIEESGRYFYHGDHLGSTSYVTDARGRVSQYVAYMPYGEALFEEHSNTRDMPYLFNAKERDEETGLYYYGARYLDPETAVWYGVDPLVMEHPDYSPYAYCLNNPINFFDPDGMDEWEVNSTGHVTWIRDSEKHTLYAVDENGKRGNSLTLKKRDTFDQLANKDRKTTDGKDMRLAKGGENSQDDYAQTFLFMADNTDVEWRMDRYSEGGENRYALGTKHDKQETISTEDIGYSSEKTIAFIHNHPTARTDKISEISSMGWFINNLGEKPYAITGDSSTKYYHYPNSNYYTYFPKTGRLYNVEGNRVPSFIRNVNSNYKRLFFGTLNTR